MATITISCKNCGSKHLTVRTSQKMSANTVVTETYCQNCHSQNTIHSEIVRLRTPTFTEQPEALRYDKPFKEVDPNQLELPHEP